MMIPITITIPITIMIQDNDKYSSNDNKNDNDTDGHDGKEKIEEKGSRGGRRRHKAVPYGQDNVDGGRELRLGLQLQ